MCVSVCACVHVKFNDMPGMVMWHYNVRSQFLIGWVNSDIAAKMWPGKLDLPASHQPVLGFRNGLVR